jgi:general secretion pathway protein I
VKKTARSQAGFTLLEVLVASVIMAIAITGVLSALTTSARNAARISQYDRATFLARQKMDELLVDSNTARGAQLQGAWDPKATGDVPVGWNARIDAMEAAPGAGPGRWVMDRVQLEIWWMDGTTRRSFAVEGFRRGILKPGELIGNPAA